MPKTFIFPEHRADYEKLWQTCIIKPAYQAEVQKYALRITANRARYEALATKLKAEIPHIAWWIIGLIHHMEAGCDFGKYQHNGEKLGAVTKLVPKGILFHTWEESAIDASRRHLKGLDGSIAKVLAVLEGFNGYGYRLYHPEVKTPYLWSYTNHYSKGKYIEEKDPATGKYVVRWKPDLVSKQCGIAAVLKHLEKALDLKLT